MAEEAGAFDFEAVARAVSDKLSEDVAELAQDMMSCINSRALFGENLADFVKGEMNESVFDALSRVEYDGYVTVHQASAALGGGAEAARQSGQFLRTIADFEPPLEVKD